MGRLLKLLAIQILAVVLLASCAQNLPEVSYASYSVVFDYEGEDAAPETRLCLSIESESDVRRSGAITAVAQENGYVWSSEDLVKIQSGKTQWALHTNFVMPDNAPIPPGKYEVFYINADEHEEKTEITVVYDEAFSTAGTADVPALMEKYAGSPAISVYDKDDVLIYFGVRTEAMQDNRGIWNVYQTADYYREVWSTPDDTVICILPRAAVTVEKQ